MNPKTEMLLYRMLWFASKAMNPSFRSLDESFESWAYHNGFLKQIQRLESRGFLESTIDSRTGKRLHRLTEAGLRVAQGGRDPEACWSSAWDGRWRYFLFDIPEKHRSKRKKLTRALHTSGCGCLQRSVWIAPSTPPALEKMITQDEPDCSKLLLLVAESKGPRFDQQVVTKAWDFQDINHLYQEHMLVLQRYAILEKNCTTEEFIQWSAEEHATWKAALAADPLLPDALLPPSYLGKKALLTRKKVMLNAAKTASNLRPE